MYQLKWTSKCDVSTEMNIQMWCTHSNHLFVWFQNFTHNSTFHWANPNIYYHSRIDMDIPHCLTMFQGKLSLYIYIYIIYNGFPYLFPFVRSWETRGFSGVAGHTPIALHMPHSQVSSVGTLQRLLLDLMGKRKHIFWGNPRGPKDRKFGWHFKC